MKWPSIDEYVSLCICLLTVACNSEMQPFFYWLFVVGGNISGSGSKFRSGRVRRSRVGYGPGSGFNFKPVQTSRRAVSDPLPEPLVLLEQNTLLPI